MLRLTRDVSQKPRLFSSTHRPGGCVSAHCLNVPGLSSEMGSTPPCMGYGSLFIAPVPRGAQITSPHKPEGGAQRAAAERWAGTAARHVAHRCYQKEEPPDGESLPVGRGTRMHCGWECKLARLPSGEPLGSIRHDSEWHM